MSCNNPPKLRKPDECPHDPIYWDDPPYYNAKQAEGMGVAEIRAKFPRHTVPCLDCGSAVTRYASFEHSLAGDW